ncbi:MAG: PEPxxWA-CTERM sorting domain-containing protein [Phenylobacterium sp.]
MNRLALLTIGAALLAGPAGATTVNGTDAIYNYGGSGVAGGGSTTPPEISVIGYAGQFLTFSATGLAQLTPGGGTFGPHGPDGNLPGFAMSVSQAAGISGVNSPNEDYLAGVFLSGSEGATTGLANSDFSPAGTGETFASLAPVIDQVFFIGDGLTGTGSGQVQHFFVPTGATKLVLGIVDANGYNGPPGAYFDNGGAFEVQVNLPARGVPEPASWALMIVGFGGAGAALRRHRRPAATAA